MSYQITKELAYETEIKKGFSVKSMFLVFIPTAIAGLIFKDMVYETLQWPFVIYVFIVSLYLTLKAYGSNPDKRRYEAYRFYLKRDKGDYSWIDSPSKNEYAQELIQETTRFNNERRTL